MDEKGRLKLPAEVKTRLWDQYGKDAKYFVTSLTGDKALIYQLAEWERIEAILAQAPQFDEVREKFYFQSQRFGDEAAVDEQGRILIPAKLREEAGLTGEVTLFWNLNRIEVYSQAVYDAEAEKKKLTSEDFQKLATLGI